MSSKSIITVILRQQVNRAAGAVRRGKALREDATATDKVMNDVVTKYEDLDGAQSKAYGKIGAIGKATEQAILTQEDFNLLLQSQSLRILTIFQMTRFMAQDMQEIAEGEDVFMNMVSLGTSALLTAFQIRAITLQNIALAKSLNQEMAFSGIAGAIASINPMYMAAGFLGVAGLSAINSSSSSSSKRNRDIQRMAARSLYR